MWMKLLQIIVFFLSEDDHHHTDAVIEEAPTPPLFLPVSLNSPAQPGWDKLNTYGAEHPAHSEHGHHQGPDHGDGLWRWSFFMSVEPAAVDKALYELQQNNPAPPKKKKSKSKAKHKTFGAIYSWKRILQASNCGFSQGWENWAPCCGSPSGSSRQFPEWRWGAERCPGPTEEERKTVLSSGTHNQLGASEWSSLQNFKHAFLESLQPEKRLKNFSRKLQENLERMWWVVGPS